MDHDGGDEQPSQQEDVEKQTLEKLREAVHAQILRSQTAAAAAIRKQALVKDPSSFKASHDEESPGLSPHSSPPRSAASSQKPTSLSALPNINPGDYPFPILPDSASATGSDPAFPPMLPRTGSHVSDVTVRFRPSAIADPFTPNLSRRPTYTSWPGPRDFPSPNIYDLTLKMNADIGMESFWENLVEIFVTNFYASRVSLSIPYDLTDITNTPWGLKATYNDSVQKQQTRIKLERRQSQEAPPPLGDSESDASENTPTVEYPPKSAPRREKGIPTMTSINSQLDSMLNGRTKVYPNLKALDRDDDPLIDNAGVNRVLERGSIVMLSREYRDPEAMRRREEEILKTHQKELEEEKAGEDPRSQGPVLSKEKTTSSIPTKKDVLTAWEQTFFKPNVSGQITKYSEYEQPLASPWLQSPGPSPAILKEPTESPFFHNVESSFSSDDEEDYRSSDAVYAIGMENYRSVIHLPLVHPQTSKSISSGGESSSSSGRPPIVPIAIISFLSTVIPYPSHLITSLSSFSPLIATSLSQAIRHSNVLHQLANSPMPSPQIRRKRLSTPEERLRIEESNEDSPVTQSPGTSETSTPSWELKGHLFSPAVAEAETPSPFRSTLSTETDYFSQMHRSPQPSRATSIRSSSDTQKSRFGSESEDVRPSSSKSSWSQDTAPTKQSTTTDKQVTPIKIYRRARKSPRTIHSYGATTQYTSSYRTTYRKPKAARTRTESFAGSDPYQMHTPSSRLLKVVVDSIPVHVFTALPGTGAITWANGRTLAYRGVTAETYIEHPHDAIHPRDRDEFLERWNRMLRLETDGISQSLRIRRFDGQYRWFAAKVVPLRDARGGVVHWFGTAMDIHDAREAEIKSARQEEIEASELKYRSLAEVSPQIVFAATPALGISYANSQWMAYSGVTYGDTTQLGFLSFVHPDDRVKCALPAKGNDTQFQVEIRLLSASGVYRWHLVKCVRIEDRDGKDDLWLGTCTDIHEHKMLEHRLKDLNEAARAAEAEHRKRADDALETRRQQEFFIDMVSHELRNPLSAIVQSSEVVLNSLRGILKVSSDSTTAPELRDDVETMKSIGLCTMHMRRLIDDTINVSKLESGMLQVTQVDCQPMTIVKQIQQIFDAELQSKRIEMVIVKDESYDDLGVEWVRADPSRISQILINLLSNAIKFLDNRPERRITLTLSASVTPPTPAATQLHSPENQGHPDSQDVYLTFSIRDTGPGLKKAEMAALFQRFSQATPRTHVTYGGSGLGLFISKRLVELQRGRIYVDSVENKGSTFTFYIKAGRSSVFGRHDTKSPTLPSGEEWMASAAGKKTHVLVVEDNLINQRLLQKQLIGSGYRVSVANHGQEAFDKVLASQASPTTEIDVILMDVEMPILDGLQATRLLREAEAKKDIHSHIPVIAVSANAREEQKKRMFDAGADGYLTKPFQLPELVTKLKEQTGSSESHLIDKHL